MRRGEDQARDRLTPIVGDHHAAAYQPDLSDAGPHRVPRLISIFGDGEPNDFQLRVTIKLDQDIRQQAKLDPRGA